MSSRMSHCVLSAYPFAVLDVLVIHLAFGMMIWPFIKSLGVTLRQNSEESVTWHFLACVFVAAFLTAYVAAQWTLESILWSASWYKESFGRWGIMGGTYPCL